MTRSIQVIVQDVTRARIHSTASVILWSGLVAAVLDGADAVIFNGAIRGTSAMRIFQFIATADRCFQLALGRCAACALEAAQSFLGIKLAAAGAALFDLFPGKRLKGGKGTLEECVIDNISFTVLAANDPIATVDMAETSVGCNGGRMGILRCVNKQRSSGAKCAHEKNCLRRRRR